jgi:hypothetical protein
MSAIGCWLNWSARSEARWILIQERCDNLSEAICIIFSSKQMGLRENV